MLTASRHRAILTILVLVLGLRLFIFITATPGHPERFIAGDSPHYIQAAWALVKTGRFNESAAPTAEPLILRTPGYPLFIAAVYQTLGVSQANVALIQIFLSVLTVWLAYLIGRRLFPESAALAAAVWLALDPVMPYYSLVALSETLAVCLVTLAGLMGVRLLQTAGARAWDSLWLGLALAGATLVRAICYYLAPAVVLGLWLLKKPLGLGAKRLAWLSLVLLIPSILFIGGWQVRNKVLVNSSQYSQISSRSLLDYRAAQVYADNHGLSLEEARITLRQRVSQLAQDGKNQSTIEQKVAMAVIKDDPIGYLGVAWRGFKTMMLDHGGAPLALLYEVHHTQTEEPAQIFGVEWWLWMYGRLFHLALYACLALGLARWLLGDRADAPAHLFLLGVMIYFMVLSAGPEAYHRFRIIFTPLLAVYAGAGAAWPGRLIGRRGQTRPA